MAEPNPQTILESLSAEERAKLFDYVIRTYCRRCGEKQQACTCPKGEQPK